MSLYYRGTEIREIDDVLVSKWVATNNPKAIEWKLLPTQPVFDPSTHAVTWDGAQWVTTLLPLAAVTKYQLRRALRATNRLAAFNTYIASLPEDSPTREKWEHNSKPFSFGNAWCRAVQAGLSLTNAQMRALWRAAAGIEEDG
jgi:hypothetical protein